MHAMRLAALMCGVCEMQTPHAAAPPSLPPAPRRPAPSRRASAGGRRSARWTPCTSAARAGSCSTRGCGCARGCAGALLVLFEWLVGRAAHHLPARRQPPPVWFTAPPHGPTVTGYALRNLNPPPAPAVRPPGLPRVQGLWRRRQLPGRQCLPSSLQDRLRLPPKHLRQVRRRHPGLWSLPALLRRRKLPPGQWAGVHLLVRGGSQPSTAGSRGQGDCACTPSADPTSTNRLHPPLLLLQLPRTALQLHGWAAQVRARRRPDGTGARHPGRLDAQNTGAVHTPRPRGWAAAAAAGGAAGGGPHPAACHRHAAWGACSRPRPRPVPAAAGAGAGGAHRRRCWGQRAD